ncbi:MAG TPA: amidase [Vicinamibacterales bacterium]|nr:amidase [Vicinamibacterales bacterium]
MIPADTITSLAPRLKSGDLRSERLTEDALATITTLNPRLNAFIAVTADDALAAARRCDQQIAAGQYRGALHGVPISLKDLIDVAGVATTAASKLREHYVAQRDAPIVTRLREAGAVIVGKTNLHEFAFGTTNEDSAWGPARHPVDETRSPGGSSGGSAVAVATGMSVASIGTDTGGSIRIPAAACGIVGLKPGYGEISANGVVPLSRQLDHVGPLTRSVDDAELLYDVLRGVAGPAAVTETVDGLFGVRVGVLGGYFSERLSEDVESAFQQTVEAMRGAGARMEPAGLAHAADIAPIYLHLVLADGAAYHAAALERKPHAYTENVRVRLEMGRYVLGEDYARARRGREVIRREVEAALHGVDVLICPSLAVEAPPLGAASVAVKGGKEPVRNVMLRLTQPFNLSGHPAISIPCGATKAGLPIGLQLVGHHQRTRDLLRVARRVERVLRPR